MRKIDWTESRAALALVKELANEFEKHSFAIEYWVCVISVVEGEHLLHVFLASKRAGDCHVLLVVVEVLVQDWPQQLCEHELPHQPRRVVNDHGREVDELECDELFKPIVTDKVRLSEVDITAKDYRIKVSVWIQDKPSLKVQVEILEAQLHLRVRDWPEPCEHSLPRLYSEVFKCRKINSKEPGAFIVSKPELHVLHANLGVRILNIPPLYLGVQVSANPERIAYPEVVLRRPLSKLRIQHPRQEMSNILPYNRNILPIDAQSHPRMGTCAPVVPSELLGNDVLGARTLGQKADAQQHDQE